MVPTGSVVGAEANHEVVPTVLQYAEDVRDQPVPVWGFHVVEAAPVEHTVEFIALEGQVERTADPESNTDASFSSLCSGLSHGGLRDIYSYNLKASLAKYIVLVPRPQHESRALPAGTTFLLWIRSTRTGRGSPSSQGRDSGAYSL